MSSFTSKSENPLIILGDSPYLKSVEDKVQYILERYPSIGINGIINKFKPMYHAFVDIYSIKSTNKYKNMSTISLASYGDLIRKANKELFKSFSFNSSDGKIYKEDSLAWCGFTHDFALSYAIKKGYKDIILLGAADFVPGNHCSRDSSFNYSNIYKEQSKEFIEKFCIKYARIRTCNKDSILNVERIDIDDLLK